jgi:hypothetical protein
LTTHKDQQTPKSLPVYDASSIRENHDHKGQVHS